MRLRGVIFQSDERSRIGAWLIRPFEGLDRRVAGIAPAGPGAPALAMHAGLHVDVEIDGEVGHREFVAEQLVGPLFEDLRNGLHWTPIDRFRERDRGGWDVTIPVAAFRGMDEAATAEAVERLNQIDGHPFFGEDCVAFIERNFGGRRLFADSPIFRALGMNIRVADPALPLLRRDADLEPRVARLIRADALRDLPDALGQAEDLSATGWTRLAALGLALALLAMRLGGWLGHRRR